ncbi:cyclin-dependent protein kinase inhibitor SMR9-like [Carica papaya]|uniref:cyclin-dependent protein kinase inhibitor SMR9-like n=1 Tax=Carica papaya TaxID=3649 RepID=UPI000B8CFE8C|nr:cyclin-dependent protein kinase inhibitor SMR9-like [Carica papaya]
MAPSSSRVTRRRTKARKPAKTSAPSSSSKPRKKTTKTRGRIQCKKTTNQARETPLLEDMPCCCSSTASSDNHHSNLSITKIGQVDHDDDVSSSNGCSTPKAQRFRIPAIDTCPPAPKKKRVISNCSTLQRRPIAFFAPPDLELFFFFARIQNISV